MHFRISAIFFLLAGVSILLSLSWLDGAGFSIWLLAKAFYFGGIMFFIFRN